MQLLRYYLFILMAIFCFFTVCVISQANSGQEQDEKNSELKQEENTFVGTWLSDMAELKFRLTFTSKSRTPGKFEFYQVSEFDGKEFDKIQGVYWYDESTITIEIANEPTAVWKYEFKIENDSKHLVLDKIKGGYGHDEWIKVEK